MRAPQRIGWLSAISLAAMPSHAIAQRVSCDQYARDYSNIVAPRSGGAVIANPMTQYPGGNQRSNQTAQAHGNAEWREMAPNQDAYRMAYERCMTNRR